MKPVAWMDDHGCLESHLYQWMIDEGGWFPLYTAPKELSEEEIDEVASNFSELYESEARVYAAIEDAHGFAKAILKKASEK